MAFHDVRLPDAIEQGASGGPTFQTTVIPMSSGAEQRNEDWVECLHSWELSYGVQNKLDYAQCRAFFFARRGRSNYFRFKDWSDYKLTDEPQGVGNGTNQIFQLIATYESGGPNPYIRRITRPVGGTIVWKVAGVPVAFTQGALGVFTLTTPPASLALVTASAEFDIPSRFDVDKFNLMLSLEDAGAIGSLPVIEVRE
jgi:uncharacterized protein (TIGR02217 family)